MQPAQRELVTAADAASVVAAIASTVRLRSAPGVMTTRVIAIDGPGGAGKTTFATQLAAEVDAEVVHTDDFAGFDRPAEWWPQVIETVLDPLFHNRPVEPFKRARWTPDEPEQTVSLKPSPYLVLEGVRAACEDFAPFLTYTIFFDAPRAVRRVRASRRYSGALPADWERWAEGQEMYRQRERPDKRADVVVIDRRDL